MCQRSGDGRFRGRIEVLAINCWKELFKCRDAGREDCFCSEKDHPEFPRREECESRGTEGPERGSVFTWTTDRLHDLRLLSSDWRQRYSIGLHRFILYTLHDDNNQEFDTRWMSKTPSDDILLSLYKLRIRESAQLKTVLELYDLEIHQKISMRDYQKLKTMVKRSTDQKLRFRNLTPEMRGLKQVHWSRIERD